MTLRKGYCHVNSELRKAAMSINWNTMSIVRCTLRCSICRSIDAGLNNVVSFDIVFSVTDLFPADLFAGLKH